MAGGKVVLIVDDDILGLNVLAGALTRSGFKVHTAENAGSALAVIDQIDPTVLVTDVMMPDMNGIDFLSIVQKQCPGVDVVVVTEYWNFDIVHAAYNSGAVEVLAKPIEIGRFEHTVATISAARAERHRASRTRHGHSQREPTPIIARDSKMLDVFKRVVRVASTDVPVLIRGETGTGKELIAKAIHNASGRAGRPFIPLNCTAVAPTLLESELFGHVRGAFTGALNARAGLLATAGSGTLFLDEIGDAPLDLQAKLLRVLESGEFYPVGSETAKSSDTRFLFATHRDLDGRVESGDFRQDLYYRVNVVCIDIPPLRERPGDIPLLADHFLSQLGRDMPTVPILSSAALSALQAYSWPGNVRELKHTVARAAALAQCGVIWPGELDLEDEVRDAMAGWLTLQDLERQHVARALRMSNGNKARAARALGITRTRLDRLIVKYSL